jgi:hypothetical protein
MYTSMGWGVYVFFATCLVCASVYAWFFIHDTKGLRMDEMDRLFGFERSGQHAITTLDGKTDYESEHIEEVGAVHIDHSRG